MIYSAETFAELLFGDLALSRKGNYYVAYSGGVDSTVLLHLMQQLSLHEDTDISVTALHVDHGLQAQSGAWSEHCERVCEALDVPLIKTKLSLESSSELEARNKRYQWFKEQIKPKSTLMTGHHQQDRAETFLFNLMRGTGSAGLSSLRAKSAFHGSDLVRPLVYVTQTEINEYAQSHKLDWIEDPSNNTLAYSRNQIRHQLLPVLEQCRPDAIQNIARAANNLEQENGLLREVAISDLVDVREHPKHPLDDSHALCFDDIQRLSVARQTNLVRFWLYSLGLHIPSKSLMQRLLLAFANPPASTTVLQESGTQFRFYKGFMYVMPSQQEAQVNPVIDWENLNQPIDLYQQKIRVDATHKLRELLSSQSQNSVRVAARNQVVNPKALQGHSLNMKKWLQDIGIPPWRRQALPLLTLPKVNSDVVLGPVDQQLQSDWVLLECPIN